MTDPKFYLKKIAPPLKALQALAHDLNTKDFEPLELAERCDKAAGMLTSAATHLRRLDKAERKAGAGASGPKNSK